MVSLIPRTTLFKEWFTNSRLENVNERYDFLESIGRGAYGKVFKAVNRSTGEHVAIKVIQKASIEDPQQQEQLYKELNILQTLDHANICSIREIYENAEACLIVTNFYEGGELFNRIVKQRTLTEQYAAFIMKRLFHAVSFCHEAGVVHRDLKPENILLVSDEEDSDIKIIDFGLADRVDEARVLSGYAGTEYYIAPEILTNQPYTEVVDCWSLGVILYFMLGGHYPFSGKSRRDTLLQVYNGYFSFQHMNFDDVSRLAKDLISRLLIKEPMRRITAKQALSHPWVVGLTPPSNSPLRPDIFDSIRNYLTSRHMRRMALMSIAAKVDDRKIRDLNIAFLELDQNSDGYISKQEFASALERCLGVQDESFISTVWQIIDSNKNGELDYIEFISLCMGSQVYTDATYLKIAFEFFDRVLFT